MKAGLHTECQRTFSDEVSDACRAGCMEAECCWNEQTTFLCSADTVHNCVDYKDVCSFLNDRMDGGPYDSGDEASPGLGEWPFPNAPEGLSVYCDPTEMEDISLHICEDKCGDAECCWKTGVNSCISEYPPQACRDYTQACGILNRLATAPDNSHTAACEL